MRVQRRLDAERAQHVDLARRVVDVVVAADHVRDLHVVVVDDDAEVVGGRAVGARDDQVVELAAVERDRAVHHVVDDHLPLVRVAEAHHRVDARHRLLCGGGSGRRSAASPCAPSAPARSSSSSSLRAVAVVGLALAQELVDDLPVPVHALRLVERPLVVVEAEPLHAVEDRLHRLGRGALAVGVLDAQDERAAVTARVQPAEQRRAHAADVQHAGGTRGEAGADGHGGAPDKVGKGRGFSRARPSPWSVERTPSRTTVGAAIAARRTEGSRPSSRSARSRRSRL